MTKEKFLKTAKIIIAVWLVFMIIDAVAYTIDIVNMTEQSGGYIEYRQVMLQRVLEGKSDWTDIQSIGDFRSSRLLGRVLLVVLRLTILIPWLLSIRVIKKGKITRKPIIFLLIFSSITILSTWGSLVAIPSNINEGTQNWITYIARALNYPIAIATTAWAIMWLNSPNRPKPKTQAKSIKEQRKQFKSI